MVSLQHLLLILVCLLCCDFRSEGQISLKVYIPRSNATNIPHLRMKSTLPTLREFTFCSWIRPEVIKGGPSIMLAYSTPRTHKEIEIMLYKGEGDKLVLGFHMLTSFFDFKCAQTTWEAGVWHHFCLSWFSPTGEAKAIVKEKECVISYKNEITAAIGRDIQGGGTLVIGRSQLSVGDVGFLDYSWRGDLADFHFWDEALDKNQMIEAGRCKGKRKQGNIIAFLKTGFVINEGGVEISKTNLCVP